MFFKDLLSFKNQHIVDELYKRVKEEDNEELDAVYQEISDQNKTAVQTTQYHYRRVMKKILSFLDLIKMFVFFVLFIVLGSFILATLIGYFNMAFVEFAGGLYDLICGFGAVIVEKIFDMKIPEGVIYSQNAPAALPIYAAGMTVILIIFFLGLYIISLFKKQEKKELKLSLEECYHYLQANEDDDWSYIKSNFERRIQKHKNKEFYEHYYQSYIQLFKNHQQVQGTFQDLTRFQQVKLCFFTFTNTVKNIFGSFSKPIYFSIAILIAYYRNLAQTSFLSLKVLLDYIPGGQTVYDFLTQCYHIVIKLPGSQILYRFDLEFAKVAAFCILMTIIWFISDVVFKKIRETRRQYHRRLNFYTKQNQGIYEEKRTYPKAYNYGVQFTIFLFFVGAVFVLQNLDSRSDLHDYLKPSQKLSQSVMKKITPYAEKHNDFIGYSEEIYLAHYIYENALYEDLDKFQDNQSYMKIYTFRSDGEAFDAIYSSSLFSKEPLLMLDAFKINSKLLKSKGKFQYYYSDEGFIIKDKQAVIVMKNSERLDDKLFDDEMTVLSKKLTQKEIKKLMKNIGYSI